MRSLPLQSAVLVMMWLHPVLSYNQSFQLPSGDESPAARQDHSVFRTVAGKHETQAEPPTETTQEGEYRPAREIKRFTEPTILLRGTAEDIGLDSRALATFLGKQFLQDFAFLQNDFAFDKTYETWEIGLFDCEAWAVGSNYPIAFHVQCAAGSMDEPRNWHYASLGYGPKDRIVEIVRRTLDAIVAEYAAFVRKARGKLES